MIKTMTLGSLGLGGWDSVVPLRWGKGVERRLQGGMRVLGIWKESERVVEEAKEWLEGGSSGVEAIERALNWAEDSGMPEVGVGGWPNEVGEVELDAGIMAGDGRCGAVAGLKGIAHAITVARMVMETGDHVLLAGEGARAFALERGMKRSRLLDWRKLKEAEETISKPFGKDTMGLIVQDREGKFSCGVTTSGRAWRREGRVGDCAIVGGGFFAEDGIGAAIATGIGELAMRDCLAFAVVERMRQGGTAQEACEEILERIKRRGRRGQLAVVALDKEGNHGVASIEPGFILALVEDRLVRWLNA